MSEATAAPADKPFSIAGKTYLSRLLVGTGKYESNEAMKEALEDPARLLFDI